MLAPWNARIHKENRDWSLVANTKYLIPVVRFEPEGKLCIPRLILFLSVADGRVADGRAGCGIRRRMARREKLGRYRLLVRIGGDCV